MQTKFRLPLRPFFICCVIYLISTRAVFASDKASDSVKEQLAQAYALINVKPMKTIEILEDLAPDIDASDGPTRVRAYTMGIWAAQYISSLSHVQHYRDLLVAMANSDAFSQNKAAILSALVAQYWRTRQFNLAKQFGVCALKNADTEARVVSIGITMSIVLRAMDEVDESVDIADFALVLAEKLNNQRYVASIYNNNGVLYLERENYQAAVGSFETALNIRHQIADLAGQVAAGTNMLLSYFFMQDWEKFERLSTRVERLQQLQNSTIMLAYYNWLKTAFLLRDWKTLEEQQLHELREDFSAVKDPGIQRFLTQIAIKYGWNMPVVEQADIAKQSELDIRDHFPMCDWAALEQLPHSDIMAEFRRAQKRLSD